jgi:hypothetical protein
LTVFNVSRAKCTTMYEVLVPHVWASGRDAACLTEGPQLEQSIPS